MGQCSSVPAEARQNGFPVGKHGVRNRYGYVPQKNQDPSASMTDSVETEATTPLIDSNFETNKGNGNGILEVKKAHSTPSIGSPPTPTPHPPSNAQDPTPMEEVRSEAPLSQSDLTIRNRCYKLNLDSDFVGMTGAKARISKRQLMGPYVEAPLTLVRTISDDSSDTDDATAAAVRTAQIFRELTVSPDGTILSQNARATRAAKRKQKKEGGELHDKRIEMSRQAANIEKAKELVEDSIVTGKVRVV